MGDRAHAGNPSFTKLFILHGYYFHDLVFRHLTPHLPASVYRLPVFAVVSLSTSLYVILWRTSLGSATLVLVTGTDLCQAASPTWGTPCPRSLEYFLLRVLPGHVGDGLSKKTDQVNARRTVMDIVSN